ncbi:MAG TPA: peptidase C13, partial [Alphaproteobacteria bacterium]
HGRPRSGLFMSAIESTLRPRELDRLLDRGCGERPTVVIASGCFSGVFASGWSMPAPNRTIVTAAQSDRASFGCSVERRFTIFDECVLENLQAHQPWRAVMDKVRACVSRNEAETGASPPSNPQIHVGRAVEALTAF